MVEGIEQILLSQMQDIEVMHEVSFFPLALGWWIFIISFLFLFASIFRDYIKKRRYKKSWQYKTELELDKIVEKLRKDNSKKIIGEINEFLKRITIQIYGRDEVASKEGEKWLKFLYNRDPKGFNWLKRGRILIDYNYMKEGSMEVKKGEILAIIRAIKNIIKNKSIK